MNAGMFFQMMGGTSSTTAKTLSTQKTGSFSNSSEAFKLEMEKAFDATASKEPSNKQPQSVNEKEEVRTDNGENYKSEDTENSKVTDEPVMEEEEAEVCEETVVIVQTQHVAKVMNETPEILKQVEGGVEADAEFVNLAEGESEEMPIILKQTPTLESDGKMLAQSNADLVKSAMLKGGDIQSEAEAPVEAEAKRFSFEDIEVQVVEGEEEVNHIKVANISSENEANLQQTSQNASEEILTQDSVKMSNEPLDLSKINIKVADAPIDTTRADAAQQMADKIIYKLNQGKHVFDMELNPAHLGKINVKMIFENGSAEIIMTTSSAKAHQLLSSQTDALRAILEGTLGMNNNIEVKQAEQSAEQFDRDNFQEQSNEKGQQQEEKKKNNEDVSFVEKLRLGLTDLELEAV